MDESLSSAIELREQGRVEEALERLLALLEIEPDSPLLNYHCAWAHDQAGREAEAVPFYEKAIELGLAGYDLMGAMLGLGSTYRALGRYDDAVELLGKGHALFPEHREFDVFLAMAQYNRGESRAACRLLLRALADTSSDPGVERYREAILFYSDRLDETW